MMTVHKVGALDAARYADYLSSSRDEERKYAARAVDRRGDYYLSPTSQDTPTAEPLGVWAGRGAEALGLSGREVDQADLLRVWEGKDPATGEILVRRGGNGEHVAAVDCTFSSPKSVSIEWGLCKDEARRAAIEAAQTTAVEAALGHLERECDLMRRRIGGDIRHETSDGLVVARFRHHTSRVTKEQEARGYGADPQLHDHCVVANLALRKDGQEAANGKWGAIDSRSLLLIQVEAGTAYRIQLQHELRMIGYRTHIVDDHFELVGISQAAIDEFSSREREVKAAIDRFTQEHGRPPREDERRNLVVYSRGGKDLNPFGDRTQWEERIHTGGIAGDRAGLYDAGYTMPTPRTLDAITAATVTGITAGNRHLTRETAVVEERELRKGVIRELEREGAGHDAEIPYFRPLLEGTHGSDELVRVDGRHWTTRAHLATERFVVDTVRARARTGGHALDPAVIEEHIAGARVPLDAEQAAAVRALCDRRAVGLVIAEAGTGKGEVARAAAQAHRASGRRVFAVATAGETAQRLGREIGADDARSVDSLVHAVRSGRLALGPGDLVVVDEAGQLETQGRWDRLLVAAQDAKLVAIGDPAQFPSIEAGGLLPVLEREIGASHLTRVYRAREEWLRDAWGAIRAGRGREAIEEFDRRGHLHVAPRRRDARDAMVAAWDRDRQGRPVERYLMVTDTTNREVDRLNALAQDRRLQAEEISGVPLEVTATDRDDPEYVRQERLYRGDRVITKRHISLGWRDPGLKNGQTATVAWMGDDGDVVLDVGDNSLVRIHPRDQEALRLNYAQHAYGAQGRTVDRVYGLFGGWSTDQESGYVSTTRCRERAELFCDADTLAVETTRTLPLEPGQREAAHQEIPEAEWHAAAREVLAIRYETSRPKLSALEVMAREAGGRETESERRRAEVATGVGSGRGEAVRSNTHAAASGRQREYITALGGAELREGATWVEASMAIDRLRGEPEGEHAARLLLADGQGAERVAEELDLAAGRRGAIEAVTDPVPEPAVELERTTPEAAAVDEPARSQAPTAGPDPDRPGHLDRGEVEAGLLGDRDGPVSQPDDKIASDRSAEVPEAPAEAHGRDVEASPGSALDRGKDREVEPEPEAARSLRVLEEERPHREVEEAERQRREAQVESQRRALEQESEHHRELERSLERDMGMDMEL